MAYIIWILIKLIFLSLSYISMISVNILITVSFFKVKNWKENYDWLNTIYYKNPEDEFGDEPEGKRKLALNCNLITWALDFHNKYSLNSYCNNFDD